MTFPAPTYGPFAERLFASLPEYVKETDYLQGSPLKRYLSGVGDELGDVRALADRIDYRTVPDGGVPGDTSDLVHPDRADPNWLIWLGQLFGVDVTANLAETEKRDAIRFASSGWRGGTKLAVANAAKSVLIGTRFARVFEHSTATGIGSGTMWDVLVVTRPTETPSPAEVLAAINRKNAKPAGVVLHHRMYEASWEQVETALPTWADWEARTWQQIESIGIEKA